MRNSIEQPRLGYRVDELAEVVGLSRSLIYQQMKNGHLKWVQIGGVRVVTAQQAEAWLASLTVAA